VPRTELPEFAQFGQKIFGKLAEFPGLTIAAVNGFCLGGGCEVAMCCDLIIAAENAVFGQPEVNLGLIPGYGGTQRLTRRVGMQRALELCVTARMVKADEAVRIGLALEKVPAGEAVDRARKIANLALSKGPVAVKLAKRAIHHGAELDLHRGLELETDLFGMSFHTEDAVEGVAAFIEKRKAEFKGK
jgi:enoyl-CoA hydratase